MPTPPIADAVVKKTLALIEEALRKGHKLPGSRMARHEMSAFGQAARALGDSNTTRIHQHIRMARARGFTIPWDGHEPSAPDAAPIPSYEAHDAAFWRRRAADLKTDLERTEHALAQISGLIDRPVQPPRWSLPASGKKKRAIGLLHISDIHNGEVIRHEETGGINGYDPHVCRARLRRLFSASISILPRWSSDCKLEGVYVAINGDLVSGSIHAELRETNALTSQQQVWETADELAAGIVKLRDAFGSVFVCVTTGNHGRSTEKTHSKRTAALSYDTMIGEALRRYFAGDKRVTVMVAPGRDATYTIFKWQVLQTHHDQGGGGGQGWAGPVLPIMRKAKQIEFMGAQTREFHDIILTAHHHVASNPTRKLFGNGSVVGYSEFSRSIRAAPEPPMQWLMLVTERWGVRERLPVVLDEIRI